MTRAEPARNLRNKMGPDSGKRESVAATSGIRQEDSREGEPAEIRRTPPRPMAYRAGTAPALTASGAGGNRLGLRGPAVHRAHHGTVDQVPHQAPHGHGAEP